MKNQKQKIYILLSVGVTIFLTIILILFTTFFNSIHRESYEIENFEIANITAQSVDIFWKGFSEEGDFKVLYKNSIDTGVFKEVDVDNVYTDYFYNDGYMYSASLRDLTPNSEYLIEIWDSARVLKQATFSTFPIKDEINLPKPLSGNSFIADWIKISDEKNTYIVRADLEGRWSLDKNRLSDEYSIEIYSTRWLTENNPLESYLIKEISAAQEANCDQISYSVDSAVKNAAGRVQTALQMNASDTQYSKCYQDVYCEAEKAGVNPRWALTIWMNESNASSYSLTGADFGGTCCAPDYNFQAQLGFFLGLSHDPCGCGGGCSKEEYYCCWANNYYYGTKSKTCDATSKAYIESVAFYYFLTANQIVPSDFNTILSKLPKPIKGSGTGGSCGATNPIEVYENDGEIPDNGDDDTNTGGICCALKVTGNDKLRGDYENVTNKTCDQIWEEGREIYGGTLEYSVELKGDYERDRCEQWWDGVCCEDNGDYEWVPSVNCRQKASEYSSYTACVQAGGPTSKETIDIEQGHNFVKWGVQDTSNPTKASDLLENPAIIQIAGFHNEAWDQVMYKDNNKLKGSDFELIAGEAYLITSTTDFEIIHEGRESSEEYSWGNKEGWQLVPTDSLDPYSDTKSVVLSFDKVDITQIALWDRDIGAFQYLLYDLSGQEYGESIKLNSSEGVFVKID
jgi:hypothetical protein